MTTVLQILEMLAFICSTYFFHINMSFSYVASGILQLSHIFSLKGRNHFVLAIGILYLYICSLERASDIQRLSYRGMPTL